VTALSPPPFPRAHVAVLGIPFDNISMEEALASIETMISSRRPHFIATANLDFLVQSLNDLELRRILCEAHLVLCDGTPVRWASYLLGNPIVERVAGSDLVPRLLDLAVKRGYRVYFLGGSEEVLTQALSNLRKNYPKLQIAGSYSPPYVPILEMDHEMICQRIRETKPDLLFVSFSCPKSEKWFFMNYVKAGVPVGIGIGATIDFIASKFKRAPMWMRGMGLEWVYRLIQEPRRLYKRYSKDLFWFGYVFLKHLFVLKISCRNRASLGKSNATSQSSCLEIVAPSCLDLQSVHLHSPAWKRHLNVHKHCIFDLGNVQVIDSSGIGFLIWLQKRMRHENGKLILISPSKSVQQLLDVMQLGCIFKVASSLSEARRQLDSQDEDNVTFHMATDLPLLILRGEIVAQNVTRIQRFCERQIEILHQRELIVDMGKVHFVDSSGIGFLVGLKKKAVKLGIKLNFSNLQQEVLNILKLTKVDSFLFHRV